MKEGGRFFSAAVPWSDSTDRLALEHEGTVVAERVRSANAPVVSLVEPADGTSLEGLDRAEALGGVRPPEELEPLLTLPEDSDPVPLEPVVMATFASRLAEGMTDDADLFVLRDGEGRRLPSDVLREAAGRRLVLVPWQPLEPGTAYAVTLGTGAPRHAGTRGRRPVRGAASSSCARWGWNTCAPPPTIPSRTARRRASTKR